MPLSTRQRCKHWPGTVNERGEFVEDRTPVSVSEYQQTPAERLRNWQNRYDAAIETIQRCQRAGLVHAEADTLGYLLWLWRKRPHREV